MRTGFFLSLCLCLLLAGCSSDDEELKARTEDLPPFSISLPEGWATNIPEGIECTPNRCIAGFAHAASGSRSALTVSVVPNLGKQLKEIVEESTANMSAHEAEMHEVSRTGTRVEYKGTIKNNPARLIATFDEANQQVGVLLLVGEDDIVDTIAAGIRMKNPALAFGLEPAKKN